MSQEYTYEVSITLNDKELNVEKMQEFVALNFSCTKIIDFERNIIKLLWEVPYMEGGHEIDNALYYILDDSRLGSYSYHKKSIKLYNKHSKKHYA